LTEDESFVTRLDEFGNHAVKELKLAGGHPNPVVVLTVVVEELVRVVADLSKLHHGIPQTLVTDLASRWIPRQLTLHDAVVDNLLPV